MELLQLRYFATVARMENISHAAAYHMIPQPAMSKTISKLERELGAALFDRTKNKISLTPEGELLFQGVQAALLHLDNALGAVQEEKRSTSLSSISSSSSELDHRSAASSALRYSKQR